MLTKHRLERGVADAERRRILALLLCVALLALPACGLLRDGLNADDLLNERSGGDTTAFADNRNAFGLSARNLTNEERRRFEVGDSFFNQNWVTAPASTDARDGLGPTLNAQSCSSCHTLDGRAKPPESADDPERGLVFRISVPGNDANGAPLPHDIYGGQIQDRAILTLPPEGRFVITYEEIHGAYASGEPYTLLSPTYEFHDLAFGAIPPDVMVSPRIAPVVVGMGLLEAIAEEDILALADPDDEDGDGVSGRPNMVWSVEHRKVMLGRFGWKSNTPTVKQQVASAFHGDIGITSSLFPDENCPPIQTACQSAPSGGSPEISDDRLDKVAFYNRTLAVPAMRDVDEPQVKRGASLFLNAGCAVCHVPNFTTGKHEIEALSNQTIFPFTDLLLHDMGKGLADGRPDFQAGGSEWRTPPLWGIGLVDTVNNHTRFLHDGRARSLAEAILWHGGEGASARDAFRNMSRDEREALIRFLNSL